MKRTGPQAQIQTNEEIQGMINDLPDDALKQIFLRLDWAKLATISQVSTLWHSLVFKLSQDLIRSYFPYLATAAHPSSTASLCLYPFHQFIPPCKQ